MTALFWRGGLSGPKRDKAQRIGRNPKTGEEVPILPRRVLVFRGSHVLKDRINSLLSGSGD